MPCRMDGYPATGADHTACQRELDKLTRMLCEAMDLLEPFEGQVYSKTSTELKSWWSNHQEWDKRRKAQEEAAAQQEAVKQAALNKLTKAERKGVGSAMTTLNPLFNEKAVEQLAWRGHMEYTRTMREKIKTDDFPEFDELPDEVREAWISATDRILELAILELKHKLES